MIVFVRFLGYFSQVTGKREERINLERGSTVEDLLQVLFSKYGREFRNAIEREGYREAIFVVNGKEVKRDHILAHGDEVAISFPMGGGILENPLSYFFNPRSIAVFGATGNKEKLGYVLFKNIIDSGFDGQVYPIHPKEKEILGYRVYQSILEIEGEVDLAIISIPGKYVLPALNDCVAKGVKACVILSAGFGEVESQESRAVQEKMYEIAKESGVRIIGPNCMGILDTHTKINASYFWEVPMDEGNVAFISQSGAFGGIALHYVRNSLLKLSRFVSIGNMVDVDFVEMMEFLGSDEKTDVIMLLMEGLKDGRKFIDTARSISSRKPVLVYKIGRTGAGTRAARSHTGSMAGEFRIFEAACRQSRVLLFKNMDEMLDTAQVLSTQPLPSCDSVGIITISGGPSVAVSDLCEELGLKVPEFDSEAKKQLKEVASPIAALSNPLDMTPATPFSNYSRCVDIVMSLEYIGGVIAINVGLDSREFAEAFVNASRKYGKPVVAYVVDTPVIHKIFRDNKIPVLSSPERCAYAFKNLVTRANWMLFG